MTRTGAALLSALLLLVGGGQAAQAASPSKAKVHGYTLSGTVVSLDQAKKTLVVKSASGKTTTLLWTNASQVIGGKLATGQAVVLRYLDRDGKHIATSIRIVPPPGARTPAPTAAPPSSPSPR